MSPHRDGSRSVVAICFLAAALTVGISEILIFDPRPAVSSTQLTVATAGRDPGGQVTLDVQVNRAGAARQIRLVARTGAARPINRIAVLVDQTLQSSGSDLRTVKGVYDNLATEATLRGLPFTVTAVDAAGMERLLQDVQRAQDLVVVNPMGVLPANSFSLQRDLLTPWLRAGGRLVWAGDLAGYYSASPGQVLGASPDNPGLEGNRLVYGGRNVLLEPFEWGRQGSARSAPAEALELAYTFTHGGVLSTAAVAAGGGGLGWLDAGGRSSIAWVPDGSGGILTFGGEVRSEVVLVNDLLRLLLFGFDSPSSQVAYQDFPLSSSDSAKSFEWKVPLPSEAGLTVVAFDPDDNGVYLRALPVAIPG